jgi:multidrug efflux pump subunit AcrB
VSDSAQAEAKPLGVSGRLARAFQTNPLTPVLALAALLLGLVAVLITPREEEPQIDVTMANVFVALPGSSAEDVEGLISVPLQQALSEVEGVKHVYAMSRAGMSAVTVEFDVGIPRREALVRLYNQVYSNADLLPPSLGASPPLVRPMGIDDVPVMSVTLWTDDAKLGATELGSVARSLETELKRVAGTRDVYTIGAPKRAVLVELDATRLAAYGMTVNELSQAIAASNVVLQAGERVDASGRQVPLTAGTFLADAQAVQDLVLGLHEGEPLLLSDVAHVRDAADLPTAYVWHALGAGAGEAVGPLDTAPAVTLAIAKKPGANAADITREIRARLVALEGGLIPEGVYASVTRDYGATANDKAITLIKKLVFATMAVVLLVLFALGWREAVVVGSAVILTLAVTLFASWAMGFTINRVSLFALIFSIGILVDDAIVVVENIHRHMTMGGKTLREALPAAVDEIGGPTILATFTVIAALLPMAFVTGLMGPYMRPIPVNASVGMVLSLLIALTVTPWLAVKLLSRHYARLSENAAAAHGGMAARLHAVFERVMRPFLDAAKGARRRGLLFMGIGAAVALSLGLVLINAVVLKMLPFDNKSEFQVVVDLPEGTPLERTNALLVDLATALRERPEVADVQAYAGTSAPVNFNGLVRQYYLREGATMGDLQVNLVERHARSQKSHDIAREVRPTLQAIAARYGAALKVVEVPPGPPVLSPLVAEIYGPDAATTRKLAKTIAAMAAKTEGIVDIDTTVEAAATRELVVLDRVRAARLGVNQQAVADTLALAVGGRDATFIRDGAAKQAVPVHLRLPAGDQARIEELLALKVRAQSGQLIPLVELVEVRTLPWEPVLMQKDLLPVVYVLADEAGDLDSPLYGMFDLVGQLGDAELGVDLTQRFFSAPDDALSFVVKWDGEWQVTWQTFRDMGLAYAAGLVLIYLLIVAQFRSYMVPLIIMAPIPLTVIGVMPGHALFGAQFTATSMIGMIALAGIIVRNSILLVDFINHERERGRDLADAVVDACAVRAQPIALTALAAMLGALFILDDPIFNGLAISLIFGIAVSTVLTLIVIPLLYFVWLKRTDGSKAART